MPVPRDLLAGGAAGLAAGLVVLPGPGSLLDAGPGSLRHILGGPPQWTAAGAAAAYPALIGHLLYGAGLGAIFYALEARQSPWWVSRTQTEAERRGRRRRYVLTSARRCGRSSWWWRSSCPSCSPASRCLTEDWRGAD